MLSKTSARGFTLIELIITISILAVLVTVLVVAINPAEQLSRSRDAKRAADLDALRSTLNLYIAQATSTVNLDGQGNITCVNGTSTDRVYVNSTATLTSLATATPSVIAAEGLTASSGLQIATGTLVEGGINSSWLPALISHTPGGSPLSVLPADPKGTSDGTYYYSYACDVGTSGGLFNFELNADFESTYFQTDIDVDGTDGGQSATKYEVGTDPGLDLL